MIFWQSFSENNFWHHTCWTMLSMILGINTPPHVELHRWVCRSLGDHMYFWYSWNFLSQKYGICLHKSLPNSCVIFYVYAFLLALSLHVLYQQNNEVLNFIHTCTSIHASIIHPSINPTIHACTHYRFAGLQLGVSKNPLRKEGNKERTLAQAANAFRKHSPT